MSDRLWCEIPTVKGAGCTRHTNYHVRVSAKEYKEAFPHDRDVDGHFGSVSVYICGNHKHALITKGTASETQFTHLDGPGGLIRR